MWPKLLSSIRTLTRYGKNSNAILTLVMCGLKILGYSSLSGMLKGVVNNILLLFYLSCLNQDRGLFRALSLIHLLSLLDIELGIGHFMHLDGGKRCAVDNDFIG